LLLVAAGLDHSAAGVRFLMLLLGDARGCNRGGEDRGERVSLCVYQQGRPEECASRKVVTALFLVNLGRRCNGVPCRYSPLRALFHGTALIILRRPL
jgi:hypothetical protein